MSCVFTHSTCHIDLAALQRNFRRNGDSARLMPVIKADAYGHGLLQAARALEACGASRFAVGCVDEGVELRRAGHAQEIIALLPPVTDDELRQARAKDVTPLICTFADLERARAVATAERPMPVVIKAETGMHRLGFRQEDVPALIETLRAAPELTPTLTLTHGATEDCPDEDEYTSGQIAVFTAMSDALRAAFPSVRRSMLNSAGTLLYNATLPYEVARPGITLYGGNPFVGTAKEAAGADFEWAMSLSSLILQVTELRKGETVSYGRIYTAPRDMRLAVVSAGYATGVPRSFSNCLDVLIHGRRARQVGRVCMSMIMVDVTDIPGVKAGEEVWLLGGEPVEGETAVTPQDWATRLGSISYEILCSLGAMNPRVWHG